MSSRFTIKELERLKKSGLIRDYREVEVIRDQKKPKFGNVKTEIDGIIFDSAKEAKRYIQLRYRKMVGEITELELQREFKLEVNGEKVASYFADFCYIENGVFVVEDVKSSHTRKLPVYRLKKKLMKSIWGIEIREV